MLEQLADAARRELTPACGIDQAHTDLLEEVVRELQKGSSVLVDDGIAALMAALA
jgi:hypothetical protein